MCHGGHQLLIRTPRNAVEGLVEDSEAAGPAIAPEHMNGPVGVYGDGRVQ